MSISVTISSKRQLAGIKAAYQASIPADPETPAPYASEQAYAQGAIERVCESYAEQMAVDRIPVAVFVRRFGGVKMDAIQAAALTDPVVAQILDQIDAVTYVRLGAATTIDAMAYLVGAGHLTQAESDVILDY